MELEQIEVLADLSMLSRIDLYNLLGRAEQLHKRLKVERKRRKTESDCKTSNTTDHGAVGVTKSGLSGTWPIMHFKNGQRVSITWFKGTVKDAYIERNRLMANGGDFRVGIRKEDFWSPGAINGERGPHRQSRVRTGTGSSWVL
jgi:hypothetical protein